MNAPLRLRTSPIVRPSLLLLVLILIAVLASVVRLSADQPSQFKLSTDDTQIEIGVTRTASGYAPEVLWLSDTTTRSNWVSGHAVIPLLARVWTGGHEQRLQWRFAGAKSDHDLLRLKFTNASPVLLLESVWCARPGRGPVQHWVEVFNATTNRVTVSQQESLALHQLAPGTNAALWWIRRGGASATTEGGTYTQPLSNGTVLVLTNTCEWGSGSSPVPWLAVQESGWRGLYVGWEFSGLGRVQARSPDRGELLNIDVGLWPEFKTDIEPAETLRIPAAFVGCYNGDVEEGSYSLHRFIIEKLRPKLPSQVPDPILTYNLYLDYGMTNAIESDVLRAAQFCADLGFEAFMPDAMWYPEVGDWRWDARRFPRGMKPVRQLVRDTGMRQALWCAWSNGGVSEHPDALNVHAHADWFSTNSPADWKPGPHYGAKLCFGSDAARAWAMNKTQSLVREHDLDYLKHDSDPIVNRCLQTTHRHRHGVDASYWATLGYYEVQDTLRKKFPHLIIEDCSGGGHIKDFGIIQRTHLIATTDMLSNLADRQSMYDTTFAFPPLMLQCYTYDNYWPVKGDRPSVFLWRSAMMGAWHIDPTDTATWSNEEVESARQSARIYREWIRPMLKDVKVHHVLPRPDGTNWDGMFFWSAPLHRGTLFVFRPDSPEPQHAVKLKGLAGDQRYWVWSEDGSVTPGEHTGSELLHEGINVSLTNRFQCDLVYVRAAKLGKPDDLNAPGRFKLRRAGVEAGYFTNVVTLCWSESRNARDYAVRVSDDANFTSTLAEIRTSQLETKVRLPAARQFFWAVQARSLGGVREVRGGEFVTGPLRHRPAGVVFASDLAWSRATAGANNPVRRDQNIHGRTLRLGREHIPKGIWTHTFNDATPADVVIDLTANTNGLRLGTFEAEVALEDAAGRGSVQFQVLVDGVLKAQSPIMRSGAVFPLRVPVTSAREITLRVLNGGDGYSSDHAAWGNARFVAEGAADPFTRVRF